LRKNGQLFYVSSITHRKHFKSHIVIESYGVYSSLFLSHLLVELVNEQRAFKIDPTFAHFCHTFVTQTGVSGSACIGPSVGGIMPVLQLVTCLSLLPLVRFVSAVQSPQITDLKLSIQNACHIYYFSRKKKLCGSSKIERIGKKWEVAGGHIRLAADVFDFLDTAIYGRFPLLLTILYLQYLLYILFFFERVDKQEVVDRDNILKVHKWGYMRKWVDRIVMILGWEGPSRPFTQPFTQSGVTTTTSRTVARIARGVLLLHYASSARPKTPPVCVRACKPYRHAASTVTDTSSLSRSSG
jgi:hypothetical protein